MKDWLPLLGVVIAQFVIVGIYLARQRAEDRRRWHEKRLDAYRAMSKAGRDASAVFAGAEEPEDLDDRRLVTALSEAEACSLDIALLAEQDVRDKGDALQTILEMCVIFDPRDLEFPSAPMLIEARHNFDNAVRQELGIDRKRRLTVQADSRWQLVLRSLSVSVG